MQHSWIEIDIGFVNNTLDKPYSMYERSRVLERFILSVRHSSSIELIFRYFFIFSSLLIVSSRQCHLMVEYVIEHGQHEYICKWSLLYPRTGVGHFQIPYYHELINHK